MWTRPCRARRAGSAGPGAAACTTCYLACHVSGFPPRGARASVIRAGCAQGWSELRLILDRGGCSHVSRLKLGLGFLFALQRGSRAGPRGGARAPPALTSVKPFV